MGRLSDSQVKDLPEHIRKVFYEAKEAEWKNLMGFQSLKRINSEDRNLPMRNHGETVARYAQRIGAVKLDLLYIITQTHIEGELKILCRMYIRRDLVPTEERSNVYAPTISRFGFILILYWGICMG